LAHWLAFAANTLGQSLADALMSGMGVSEMRLIVRPLLVYLACPLALAGAVTPAALAGTASAGNQSIAISAAE
jgi:hypothetical protein